MADREIRMEDLTDEQVSVVHMMDRALSQIEAAAKWPQADECVIVALRELTFAVSLLNVRGLEPGGER